MNRLRQFGFHLTMVLGIAAVCEILGVYLVWQWLRLAKPWWYGVAGFALLAAYGVLPTLQPANFGRVYAAYGGFFIALALMWGWQVDGVIPDRYDWIGLACCLLGTTIILAAPHR